jgi:hypothetical protein
MMVQDFLTLHRLLQYQSQSLSLTLVIQVLKRLYLVLLLPTLLASTQYHLVLNADAGYAAGEQSGAVAFDNTGLVTFTYNSVTGEVEYSSPVNLSNVEAGHFWSDSNGELFTIQSVSDADDQLFIAPGQDCRYFSTF